MKKRQRSSLDGGAGSSATAAGACSENSVAAYVSTDDADALDCGICYLPLKPPIFQCDVGHVVCASCRDKLTGATGKCHVCGVAMAGGYRRCHAMERVVEAVRAPCPNAAYGCGATPAYHARDEHLRACPHAPCHCPGKACGFVGSRAALLGHVSAVHGWPCTIDVDADDDGVYKLRLHDGFNFLLADCTTGSKRSQEATPTDKCLLLLNVVRQPFGRTISVVWIDSHAGATAVRRGEGRPASKEMECMLRYYKYWQRYVNNHNGSYQVKDHYQESTFRVACTDLSKGVPNPDVCFQFVLPSPVTEGHDNDVALCVSLWLAL